MSTILLLLISLLSFAHLKARLKWITLCFLFLAVHYAALSQTVPATNTPAPSATNTTTTTPSESKLKFVNKLGHWLTTYGMSGEEFVQDARDSFKTAAFAETYIECIIDYDTWLFNLLNRVTKLRNEEKQSPYIFFELAFKPKDETLTSYTIPTFTLKSSNTITGLDKIATDAHAKYLKGKIYTEPVTSIPDVEKAVKEVLNVLKEKLGNSLAPDLMVRYQNEFFWNGHEINILDTEGNSLELEAINKKIQPYNPNDIVWTNADPFGSKGVVDMTGVSNKAVSYKRKSDTVAMTVTVKRASLTDDVNEILKAAIIEVLSAKKKEAQDSITVLKQDSTLNAKKAADLIAKIEAANFPLESDGSTLTPMFDTPKLRSDSIAFESGTSDRALAFKELKKRKKIRNSIRKKVNVVAFANLVVDHPDEIKTLLDELLKNSGRLIAQLILGQTGEGKKDAARNIVVDFLNKNLERIAGGRMPNTPVAQSEIIHVVETTTSATPTFKADQFLYINEYADFKGKDSLITALNKYLPTLETPLYVFINYSQDNSRENYLSRASSGRPKGLPAGAKFKVFTLVNMPGSVMEDVYAIGDCNAATSAEAIGNCISDDDGIGITSVSAKENISRLIESIRCAYLKGESVKYIMSISGPAFKFNEFELSNKVIIKNLEVSYPRAIVDDHLIFDPGKQSAIKDNDNEPNAGTWYFEYNARAARILFSCEDKNQLQLLSDYLKPTQDEWTKQMIPKIKSLEADFKSAKFDYDEWKDMVFSYPCAIKLVSSVDLKFQILKLISKEIWVDALSENVVIDILNSVVEKDNATKLIELLEKEKGLLREFDDDINNEEYDDYYSALVNLFLRAQSLDTKTVLSSIAEAVTEEEFNKLIDNDLAYMNALSKKGLLIWSDPGYIKFFTQTGLTAVNYSSFSIEDNGSVSFKVDHVNLTGDDLDFNIKDWPAFKPVVVLMLTSSNEINPFSSEVLYRGQAIIIPAIAINHLNKVENFNAFMRVFDGITIIIPAAYSLKAARYGYLGIEIALFSIQQIMEDYNKELQTTENGKAVLRAWMVFNLLYTVKEMGGGSAGLKKSMDNLLAKADNLKGDKNLAEVATKMKNIVSQSLKMLGSYNKNTKTLSLTAADLDKIVDNIPTSIKDVDIDKYDVDNLKIDDLEFSLVKEKNGGIKASMFAENGIAKCVLSDGFCFTAGTLIRTDKGNVAIEMIKGGERVITYSHDEKTNSQGVVKNVFKRTVNQLAKLVVAGSLIFATPEHPLFANGQYIKAGDLHKGDSVLTSDGSFAAVESVTTYDTLATVYNFEVEGDHNYFIGEKGLLVHNSCGWLTIKNAFTPEIFRKFHNNVINGGLDIVERRQFYDIVSTHPKRIDFVNKVANGNVSVDSWQILKRNNRDGGTNPANGLINNIDALEALTKIRKNSSRQKYGVTDDMLGISEGWGFSNVQVSYKQVVDNMDRFLTFIRNQKINCENCEYLFSRFSTDANTDKQAVFWIMEDIAGDAKTFSGKSIVIEKVVSKSNGDGGRIDVVTGDDVPLLFEYKWYSGDDGIRKSLFIDEFVRRDLNNVSSLKQLQWRVKGKKLAKSDIIEFLNSSSSVLTLSDKNKLIDLFQSYGRELDGDLELDDMDDLIEYLGENDTWYNQIFK